MPIINTLPSAPANSEPVHNLESDANRVIDAFVDKIRREGGRAWKGEVHDYNLVPPKEAIEKFEATLSDEEWPIYRKFREQVDALAEEMDDPLRFREHCDQYRNLAINFEMRMRAGQMDSNPRFVLITHALEPRSINEIFSLSVPFPQGISFERAFCLNHILSASAEGYDNTREKIPGDEPFSVADRFSISLGGFDPRARKYKNFVLTGPHILEEDSLQEIRDHIRPVMEELRSDWHRTSSRGREVAEKGATNYNADDLETASIVPLAYADELALTLKMLEADLRKRRLLSSAAVGSLGGYGVRYKMGDSNVRIVGRGAIDAILGDELEVPGFKRGPEGPAGGRSMQ